MSLPVRTQAVWWLTGFAVFLLALYVLRGMLLPFVLGCALAYLLDPLADRLERAGLSRTLATAIIAVGAFLIVVVAFLMVVPALAGQVADFIGFVPQLGESLQAFVNETIRPWVAENVPALEKYIPEISWDWVVQAVSSIGTAAGAAVSVGTIASAAGEQVGGAVTTITSTARGAFSVLLLLIVIPVVMIYMLADWDRVTKRIDDLLPRDHAETIRTLAREIEQVLSGFVRGQLMVCAILAAFYSVTLSIVGLNFGFMIGVVAGVISFIPFVGAIGGGVLAIGIAVFQYFSEPWWIAVVAGVFFFGQIVESNFITPRLVGSSVRLHPVWLLFALSAFGTLFGFVGLLIAVPTAAAIGVLLRFAVGKYLESRLYKGSQ